MIEPVLLNIYKIKKSHSGVKLTVLTVSSQILCILKTAANGVYPQLLRQLAWTRRQWLASFKEREIPVETCSSALSVPVVLPLTSLPSPHRDLATPSSSEIERHFGDDQYRVVRHHRNITLWCFLIVVYFVLCFSTDSDAIYSQRAIWYTFIVQFCVKRNNLSKKIYHWKTDFKVIIQFDNRVISNMDLFDNYNKTLEEVSYITVIKRFNFE